jgi:hypothetical protein
MDKTALFILLLGGLNWGSVGLFGFDVVAWAFGGAGSVVSRIVYILIALSAVWCFSLFFRRNEILESDRRHHHGHLDTGHGHRFE